MVSNPTDYQGKYFLNQNIQVKVTNMHVRGDRGNGYKYAQRLVFNLEGSAMSLSHSNHIN